MNKIRPLLTVSFGAALCACGSISTPPFKPVNTLTRAEAKAAACPVSVLEAGASPKDCTCVEENLFEIGQKPGAIQYDPNATLSEIGTSSGQRDIAIGLLRLDAFEQCGLFDPDHVVAKNL